MTALYNLRLVHGTHDSEFVITKFDADLNPEATYIVGMTTCTCPHHQQSAKPCRHRRMLPLFLGKPPLFLEKHVGDGWFLDWDTRLWRKPVADASPEAANGGLADASEMGKTGAPLLQVKDTLAELKRRRL